MSMIPAKRLATLDRQIGWIAASSLLHQVGYLMVVNHQPFFKTTSSSMKCPIIILSTYILLVLYSQATSWSWQLITNDGWEEGHLYQSTQEAILVIADAPWVIIYFLEKLWLMRWVQLIWYSLSFACNVLVATHIPSATSIVTIPFTCFHIQARFIDVLLYYIWESKMIDLI